MEVLLQMSCKCPDYTVLSERPNLVVTLSMYIYIYIYIYNREKSHKNNRKNTTIRDLLFPTRAYLITVKYDKGKAIEDEERCRPNGNALQAYLRGNVAPRRVRETQPTRMYTPT